MLFIDYECIGQKQIYGFDFNTGLNTFINTKVHHVFIYHVFMSLFSCVLMYRDEIHQ